MRCSSATTVPGEIVRGVRATVRGPRHVARKAGEALVGVGAMAWTGLNAAPPSPFNVRIGPHRRFTWVRGDLSEFKAIKNSLGGTRQRRRACRRQRRARAATCACTATRPRRRPEGDGPRLGPRRRRARRARQPRRRDVGAAAGRHHRSGATPAADQRRRWTDLKESGQAVGAQVLTELSGLRPADDHGAGRAAAGPPAAVQPRRDQRARPADAALHARAASSRPCTRWCRWRRTPRSGSRS